MSRRGWLLFASMCVIWGVPYLLIRVAVRDLSPAMLVLSRTLVAAAILLPLALRRNELRPLVRHWPALVVFAAIEIAIPWVLLGSAEQHLSSSLTGLLVAAVPLVAVVVAATTGAREHLSGARAAGLLLGVLGVAAIVGVNLDGASAAADRRGRGRGRLLRGRAADTAAIPRASAGDGSHRRVACAHRRHLRPDRGVQPPARDAFCRARSVRLQGSPSSARRSPSSSSSR